MKTNKNGENKMNEIAITEEITAISMVEYIYSKGGDLRTDSRKVAIAFEKEHKNVMRDIRELFKEEPNFAKLNFELCYENSDLQNGKPQPYYEMSKDGFIFLVMGFTGSKARKVKIAYIGAFNIMRGDLEAISKIANEQLIQALINERKSQQLGSLGSQFMHQRKREKILNHQQLSDLRAQIQPDLFGFLDGQ